jgi:hypothetical protein
VSEDLLARVALCAGRPSTILQLPRERVLTLVRREPTISLTIAPR